MTTYTPYPKVIFGGVTEYADNTISGISLQLGRRNIYEQAQVGIASISLWTDAASPLNVTLSESVQVQIQNTNGTYNTLFTGTISDIEISLQGYGDIGSVAIYRITGVGVLAQLNRRLTGAVNYAKEFDGTRIFNILTDAFTQDWNELSPTLTWQQISSIATWENWDATQAILLDNLLAQIDQPGDYELEAYNGGVINAWTLAQDAANSGRGYLYEADDGSLFYDSYSSRATQSPLTLTADDLLTDGLRQAAQWSEVVNDVTVTYKSNAEKYAEDYTSQQSYGQLAGTRATQLENGTDAQSQADNFLLSRAYPRTYPEQLSIALHSPTVSNATRDALISMHVGASVFTNDLPAVFGTVFDGFVEGMNWNIDRYTATVSLICSAVSETYPHQIWLQIAPTVTWAGYTPSTTEWQDL
jgi:hypothetical protein